MKRRIISILVTGVIMMSLTGCGTKTEVTDQEVVMEEESIIVTDGEDSEEVAIKTEDEISETEEVIADDGEVETEASYTEHEYFFALDETDVNTEEELDLSTLVPVQETHELKDSVTLYGSGRAMIIGYTKPDITVELVYTSDKWYGIGFPDESPQYQMVLIKTEDFIAASGIEGETKADVTVTGDDVKQTFAQFASEVKEEYELLDVPSDDMEYIEFSIPKDCENLEDWVGQMYVINNMSSYSIYCVELQDTDYGDGYLNFKLYYANSN